MLSLLSASLSSSIKVTPAVGQIEIPWFTYAEANGLITYYGQDSAVGGFSFEAIVQENQATFDAFFVVGIMPVAVTLLESYEVQLDPAGPADFHIYGKWMVTRWGFLHSYGNATLLVDNNWAQLHISNIDGIPQIKGLVVYHRIMYYPPATPLGEPDIWVPQNYSTIQEAINAASAGEVIFVSAGTYYEHVVVNKSVTLLGEDRSNTTIDGGGSGNVVTTTARNVTIDGFTIRNSGKFWAGVKLEAGSGNINITNNNVIENGIGLDIIVDDPPPGMLSGNLIGDNRIGINTDVIADDPPPGMLGNNITGNSVGIRVENSSNIRIVGNTIFNNTDYGIQASNTSETVVLGNNITMSGVGVSLMDSSNATVGYNLMALGSDGLEGDKSGLDNIRIIGNTITNNTNNGLSLINATNTVIAGNNILSNGKNGVFINGTRVGQGQGDYFLMVSNLISGNGRHGIVLKRGYVNDDLFLSSNNVTNNDGYGIYLQNSTDGNFENNTVSGNGLGGVFMEYSANNTFTGNTVTNNGYAPTPSPDSNGNGIYLNMSDNNTFTNNNISMNAWHGIAIEDSYGLNVTDNEINQNTYSGIDRKQGSPASSPPSHYIGNIITNNTNGIDFTNVTRATVTRNTIQDNGVGISLTTSNNNTIYHNNIINNTQQTLLTKAYNNTWDNSYPSGGNYWSNYTGVDLSSGKNQNQTGTDGIGDTPYILDSDNQDNYPFMNKLTFNIAVTNITLQKTIIGQGYTMQINVTVENLGSVNENFTVRLLGGYITPYDELGTWSDPGQSVILTFTWINYRLVGNYTISAYATPVPGETDTADNLYVDGTVQIVKRGRGSAASGLKFYRNLLR